MAENSLSFLQAMNVVVAQGRILETHSKLLLQNMLCFGGHGRLKKKNALALVRFQDR